MPYQNKRDQSIPQAKEAIIASDLKRFVAPKTLLCHLWKKVLVLYVSLYLILTALFVSSEYRLLTSFNLSCKAEFVCSINSEDRAVYIIFSGAVIISFLSEFIRVASPSTHHEHEFAMRILIIVFHAQTLVICLSFMFPDNLSNIIGFSCCGGRTSSQIIDRTLTVPFMLFMTISTNCQKDCLDGWDCFILMCSALNSTTMHIQLFVDISPILVFIGWQAYNVACVFLLYRSRKNFLKVSNSHGVSLSDIFVKQAARQQYNGAILVNSLLIVISIYRYILIPSISPKISTVILFILSTSLKIVYPVFVLSGYEYQLSTQAVMLIHAKGECDFERQYLIKNLNELRQSLQAISFGHSCIRGHVIEMNAVNSTSLLPGHENPREVITESLSIIKSAYTYMAKTLNASLSSIEECIVDVTSLVNAVIDCQKCDAEDRGVKLFSNIAASVPSHIICDGDRVEHVLMNLLNNALKFSSRSGLVDVKVWINESKPRFVTFAVRDEGLGISPENLKKLFNPFTQFDANENQGGKGTGVGLSMCQDTIRTLGGDIVCVSSQEAESHGTEFSFHIPLKVPSSHMLQEIHSANIFPVDVCPLIWSNGSHSRIHALVVDDIAFSRKILRNLLSLRGIVCDNVDCGFKAVERVTKQDLKRSSSPTDFLSSAFSIQSAQFTRNISYSKEGGTSSEENIIDAKRTNYHVVLIDNLTTGMTGLDTTRLLRRRGYKNIIIGLTCEASTSYSSDLLSCGADIVLVKPIDAEALDRCMAVFSQNQFRSSSF